MSEEQRKAVFAAAANEARAMIAGRQAKREQIAKQLAAIDDEIARLQTVISFDEKPTTVVPEGERSRKARKENGTWPKRVAEFLAQHPGGLVLSELLPAFQKAWPDSGFNMKTLQKMMERNERMGRFQRDDERRWHNKVNANGERRPPWYQATGTKLPT